MSSIKTRKYQDSVYVIYCHKNKKFKIFTCVKIEDKFWNLCAPKKNCPDYANVISQVAAMETRILNASMAVRAKGIEPSVELVEEEFYKQLAPRQCKQPFWQKYKEYLELLTFRESTRRQIAMKYKVEMIGTAFTVAKKDFLFRPYKNSITDLILHRSEPFLPLML
jgi:hypothetical protein